MNADWSIQLKEKAFFVSLLICLLTEEYMERIFFFWDVQGEIQENFLQSFAAELDIMYWSPHQKPEPDLSQGSSQSSLRKVANF